METDPATAIAVAYIAGAAGVASGVLTAIMTFRNNLKLEQQRLDLNSQLEEKKALLLASTDKEKWERGLTEAFRTEVTMAVRDLTTSLAEAVHSMCWVCWLAQFGPHRLTQSRIDEYDLEMHKLLPKITGLHSVIAGMDQTIHQLLTETVRNVMLFDVKVGTAGLSFTEGDPATAKELADLFEAASRLEEKLPSTVAAAIRGFSTAPGFND